MSTQTANAALPPSVESALQDGKIQQWAERGGAAQLQGGGAWPCAEYCEATYSAEQSARNGGNAALASLLAKQVYKLRTMAKLDTPPGAIGALVLGPQAFIKGFDIGSGLNRKYFRLGLPAKGVGSPASPALRFLTQGTRVGTGANMVMPKDGWVLSWCLGCGSTEFLVFPDGSASNGDCISAYQQPPHGLSALMGDYSACNTHTGPYPGLVVDMQYAAFWTDEYGSEAFDWYPMEDYTGQPGTTHIPDPSSLSQSTADANVAGELRNNPDEYSILIPWLRWTTGEPNACDPTNPLVCNPDDEQNRRECELSDHLTELDNPTADPYDVHDDFTRLDWDGDTIPTALKYGTDSWGYRKIAPTHGWGPPDVLQTQAALNGPPDDPTFKGSGTEVYDGATYTGTDGSICFRRVIVRHTANLGEVAPKEIISSYGRKVP